ncbi:hypothetical protein E2562_036054 [Oryza meyeriana var. granulata]|uniref:Cathepsin propeptide inhibitor domain-containing protein n=1 Tax=Oryza meyeriana var. granulata TaxID=110450 RepID=A0A6G1DAK2_9ORYZ|nr:hypothetical protein E2562_036054 [Oryza meyeriana var. granulata]
MDPRLIDATHGTIAVNSKSPPELNGATDSAAAINHSKVPLLLASGHTEYTTRCTQTCKLTGEEVIKTSQEERFRSSKLTDEEAMKEKAHEKWMKECNRTYKDEAEKARCFEIFKSNVEFIEKEEYLALLTPFEDIDVDHVV